MNLNFRVLCFNHVIMGMFQYWRQLSRLQKNLILTFIFVVILFGFYTVIFNSQRVLENVAEEQVLDHQAQVQKSVSAKVCFYF